MKNIKNNMKVISLFVSFFILVGISIKTYGDDVPDWVKGKLPNESDAIYAVGMANIGSNLVMARKKADDDARIELGKILSVKVKSVFEKFTKESIDLLNQEAVSSTETTTEVTKSITEATLLNVIIVERYEDEDNQIMYSLAKMKKEIVVTQFREIVSQDANKIIQEDKKLIVMKKLDDELEKWDLN
jgi:hypothetical protein